MNFITTYEPLKKINMKNLDWEKLAFKYTKVNYNVRCVYRDGKWGELEVCSDDQIVMSIAASCLHYGQEAFEGAKAYRGKDGRIRLFRIEDNAKRMIASAQRVVMAQPPVELFVKACKMAVSLNKDFVPPYGLDASLYIRPLLIGTGPQIGVKPTDEYTFVVLVMPVGSYFPAGEKLINTVVMRGYDRAAADGTGRVKVGGNYAASLYSMEEAHHKGYDTVIYMDPREKKYIDECGAANFFGIKGNKYVTAESSSILPSITNMSLIDIAADMGMETSREKMPLDTIDQYQEVCACGTAAVVSRIASIDDPENNKKYSFEPLKDSRALELRRRLVAIQCGDMTDKFGWVTFVE